jgi:hypothetical protein
MAPGNAASFALAQSIAEGILGGTIPDPTGGATTFYSGSSPGRLAPQIANGDLVYTGYNAGGFHFLRFTR